MILNYKNNHTALCDSPDLNNIKMADSANKFCLHCLPYNSYSSNPENPAWNQSLPSDC